MAWQTRPHVRPVTVATYPHQRRLCCTSLGPLRAAELSRNWADTQFTPYQHKASGKQLQRHLRADQACALVGVISVPPEFNRGAAWSAFVAQAIRWLTKKYGGRLKSVIEHSDEPQLHLHFGMVPNHGEDFTDVHQGLRAKKELPPKAPRLQRQAAFSVAMSKYQDEFCDAVAGAFGLEQMTVGGKRLAPGPFQVMKARWSDKEKAGQTRSVAAEEEVASLRAQLLESQRRELRLNQELAQTKADFMHVAITPRGGQDGRVHAHTPAARPTSDASSEVQERVRADPPPVTHPTASDVMRPGPPRRPQPR